MWKKAPELPATNTVEIPAWLYKSRALSRKGVIGSLSLLITSCMKVSRTIKLVAEVSSSRSRSLVPASIPSTIPAAWEVLPLASRVEKHLVFFLLGRSLINREISTSLIKRPSSERSLSAVSSVITYSLPSPAMWSFPKVFLYGAASIPLSENPERRMERCFS